MDEGRESSERRAAGQRYGEDERTREKVALLVAALGSFHPGVREVALVHLAGLGPPAVPHLIAFLKGGRSLYALLSIDEAVPKDPPVAMIVRALGMIGSPEAVPAIRAVLEGQKEPLDYVPVGRSGLAASAADALGKIGTPEALIALVENVGTLGPGPTTEGLRWFGEEGVVALQEALQGSSAHQRRVAAELLGSLKDARATPGLVALLGDDDERVVAAASDALGKIGDPSAIAALRDRLKATDPRTRLPALGSGSRVEVRARIVNAFASIGGASVVPDLVDEGLRGDLDARIALVRMGDEAVPTLADVLKTGDPAVQRFVTGVITDIRAGNTLSI